jgi:hypothetical protein
LKIQAAEQGSPTAHTGHPVQRQAGVHPAIPSVRSRGLMRLVKVFTGSSRMSLST